VLIFPDRGHDDDFHIVTWNSSPISPQFRRTPPLATACFVLDIEEWRGR